MLSFLIAALPVSGTEKSRKPNLRLVFISHADFQVSRIDFFSPKHGSTYEYQAVVSKPEGKALQDLCNKLTLEEAIPSAIYSSKRVGARLSAGTIAELFSRRPMDVRYTRNLGASFFDQSSSVEPGSFIKLDLPKITPELTTVFCVSHGSIISGNVVALTQKNSGSFNETIQSLGQSIPNLRGPYAVVLNFSQADWREVSNGTAPPTSIEIIGP